MEYNDVHEHSPLQRDLIGGIANGRGGIMRLVQDHGFIG